MIMQFAISYECHVIEANTQIHLVTLAPVLDSRVQVILAVCIMVKSSIKTFVPE